MTRSHTIVALAILGSFSWCCGAVLWQDRSFGFRDAANYYYPLFEWESREWRAGRVPLWNPLDNTGTPVLADTTSSVLYPGKIVFALPGSYRWRYHLYVTLHLLLAAGTAYSLARLWGASVEGAGGAALAYGFGGSVLFQYCNVVFLIGAAWLPAAIYAADRMLRLRSCGWAVGLGSVLALMTLGGDPQAAYHAGLVAALYAVCLRGTQASEAPAIGPRWWGGSLALLALAAIAGLSLASVQILPAAEWTRHSDRAATEQPRNIYEVVQWANDTLEGRRDEFVSVRGLWHEPQPETHLRHVYYFSVGPWHLAELLWPTCFGRPFPRNERWSTAIPGEDRTWTPSMYLGLLPLVLAFGAWRWRSRDAQTRFLSWLTVLALVGSFGWYGLGWLLHEARVSWFDVPPENVAIGQPVGGLYWFLVVLLPGYVYFRYPAKLLVVASLGISLLSARGWDRLSDIDQGQRIARTCIALAAISLLVATGLGLAQPLWLAWLSEAPADAVFGPLDVPAATAGLLLALLHTAVLGLGYGLLFRSSQPSIQRVRGRMALVITAVELCVANGWMTQSLDARIWNGTPLLAEAIRRDDPEAPLARIQRSPKLAWLPAEWETTSSPDRLAEVVAWERATLLPKHHLLADVAVVGTHTTLSSLDWQALLSVAAEVESKQSATPGALPLAALSVHYRARPSSRRQPQGSYIECVAPPGMALWRDPHAYPRTWIVHEVHLKPPLKQHTRAAAEAHTRDVLFEQGALRDLRNVAIIETSSHARQSLGEPALRDLRNVAIIETEQIREPLPEARPRDRTDESCHIIHDSPQRVEIAVSLDSPGCLLLNDAFYPGWQAERVTDGKLYPLKVYRANRVMRGVILPAGTHRVIYTYRSKRLLTGAVISGVAWACVLGISLWRIKRRIGSTPRSQVKSDS